MSVPKEQTIRVSDTPTLTIRGQHSEDWSELYTLWSDEAILRDSLELPYMAEEAFREHFNTIPTNTYVLIAEMSSLSGRKYIIGAVWLRVMQHFRRRHTGRLSLVIRSEQRGTGVESLLLDKVLDLADHWLGLKRVEVIIFADNEQASTIYEAKGFERELVMRRYALRDGVYSDAYLLARIWEAQ